jgi:molybdate transport system ATP-binding protein
LSAVTCRLDRFELSVDAAFNGSTTAIFGRSGAGKTTLLEMIAGLRRPDSGCIEMSGTPLFDSGRNVNVPPRERHIGYVPQDDTLFPHLSVRRNVLYGAKGSAFPEAEVVDVLEIGPIMERRIAKLSGGERRRVAIARALLTSPRLLALDEPLAGIDDALKEKTLDFLLRVRDHFRLPILFVSHDRSEVERFCEDVIVLDEGKVIARGKPGEVFGSQK